MVQQPTLIPWLCSHVHAHGWRTLGHVDAPAAATEREARRTNNRLTHNSEVTCVRCGIGTRIQATQTFVLQYWITEKENYIMR